jgi:hypothetical protein
MKRVVRFFGAMHTGRENMHTTRRSIQSTLVGLVAVLCLATSVAALEVGQKAPDFTLTAPDGKPVKLAELTAKGPVAIYTFIQAFTAT